MKTQYITTLASCLIFTCGLLVSITQQTTPAPVMIFPLAQETVSAQSEGSLQQALVIVTEMLAALSGDNQPQQQALADPANLAAARWAIDTIRNTSATEAGFPVQWWDNYQHITIENLVTKLSEPGIQLSALGDGFSDMSL